MVKASPSNAGGVGSIHGWGAKTPQVSQLKEQNINNRNTTVTNTIKTL